MLKLIVELQLKSHFNNCFRAQCYTILSIYPKRYDNPYVKSKLNKDKNVTGKMRKRDRMIEREEAIGPRL